MQRRHEQLESLIESREIAIARVLIHVRWQRLERRRRFSCTICARIQVIKDLLAFINPRSSSFSKIDPLLHVISYGSILDHFQTSLRPRLVGISLKARNNKVRKVHRDGIAIQRMGHGIGANGATKRPISRKDASHLIFEVVLNGVGKQNKLKIRSEIFLLAVRARDTRHRKRCGVECSD